MEGYIDATTAVSISRAPPQGLFADNRAIIAYIIQLKQHTLNLLRPTTRLIPTNHKHQSSKSVPSGIMFLNNVRFLARINPPMCHKIGDLKAIRLCFYVKRAKHSTLSSVVLGMFCSRIRTKTRQY